MGQAVSFQGGLQVGCCTCIWLLRGVPKVGSLMGRMTISLLDASTVLFRPESTVPTSCKGGSLSADPAPQSSDCSLCSTAQTPVLSVRSQCACKCCALLQLPLLSSLLSVAQLEHTQQCCGNLGRRQPQGKRCSKTGPAGGSPLT